MQKQNLFKAYQLGIKENQKHSGFSLKDYGNDKDKALFYQFSQNYEELTSLPRKIRRAMQRKWKHSLAGIALVLALGGTPVIGATTINVNNGNVAALRQAIDDANSEVGDFMGTDTIVLDGSTFTIVDVDSNFYGNNGLPVIQSEIIIEGNGSTIQRVAGDNPPFFRIFAINGNESGDLTLRDTTVSGGFLDGNGTGSDGGGIFNDFGMLTLENSTITENEVPSNGGGIFNDDSDSVVAIIDSTISNNIAGENGGGIFNDQETEISITSSTISGNEAGGYGGGIFNDDSDTVVMIIDSTISGNEADIDGGGISTEFNTEVSIINSTISGNEAGRDGGGINVDDSDADLDITNSTITDNTASNNGGGIYIHDDNTVNIKNTIISGNTANNDGTNCYLDMITINDIGNNLSNDDTCGFSGDNNSDINLGSLANNGGPTQTHALLLNSSAIDNVPNSECIDQQDPPLDIEEDQRGIPRPQLVSCDSGAFEVVDMNINGIDDCLETDVFGDLDGNGIADTCDNLIAGTFAPAPTMSQWGMIAFGIIAGLFGLRFLRKRKGQQASF